MNLWKIIGLGDPERKVPESQLVWMMRSLGIPEGKQEEYLKNINGSFSEALEIPALMREYLVDLSEMGIREESAVTVLDRFFSNSSIYKSMRDSEEFFGITY